MEKQIKIPEAVTNMIQRLDIDMQSYRDIVIYILTHKDLNIDEDRFIEFQKQYTNTKYAFEIAKQELEKKYILNLNNENENNKKYNSWTLDYRTNTIHVQIKEV